jgi:hypothetical protein
MFIGTDYATNRCPRRHLLDNRDILGVFDVYRSCDGVIGADALEKYSSQAYDALVTITAGKNWKMDQEQAVRDVEAKAKQIQQRK